MDNRLIFLYLLSLKVTDYPGVYVVTEVHVEHSPVFLINSRLDLFTAAHPKMGDPSPEVTGLFCLVP